MPKQKDLKRLIRGRMQKTGESYTAARARILEKARRKTSSRPSANGSRASAERAPISALPGAPRPADYARLAGMSDAAVKAKTGCDWKKWVDALDYAGAARMSHREIVQYLTDTFEVGSWWRQTVAVGYERIRGLREIGQQRDGSYEANKSKTIAVPVATLYRAFIHAPTRRRWLEAGVRIRASVPDKSVRMTWADATPVEVVFVSKGARKAQVAIQHRRIADAATSARIKAEWGERLARLAELVGAS